MDWKQLVALPVFPEFYRLIRRLFEIDIALMSPDAKSSCVLGPFRERNPFCRAIQARKGGLARCHACDDEHARQAASTRQALRYTCHAGLTEFIIPILVGHEVIAHLQCGQVLNRPPTSADLEKNRVRLNWMPGAKHPGLLCLYRKTRVIPPATQKDLIALLQLVAHQVAEAHSRLLLIEQDPRDRTVNRACDFLKRHFSDELRLDQVAAAAGTSKRNLVRIVRRRTGATVLDHLHRMRIDHACEMLIQSRDKISAIGLACGFGSIQQFNRVFRAIKLDTPDHWRKTKRP